MVIAIPYPRGTFLPVTTYGDKFPLDDLIRPFLFRFAPMALVSYPYGQMLPTQAELPLFLDSGGFAGALPGAVYEHRGDHFVLRTPEGLLIEPMSLLNRAESHPQIGVLATLDAFISPKAEVEERQQRFEWTLENAAYMVQKRMQEDLFLFGSLQAWDFTSGKEGAEALVKIGVDGIAVGGMVPRAGTPEMVQILEGVLAGANGLPVHVFGIGQPESVRQLFEMGVWSVDSSSYVRQAVSSRYYHPEQGAYVELNELTSPLPCNCPVCSRGIEVFYTGGLWRWAKLAMHNLHFFENSQYFN